MYGQGTPKLGEKIVGETNETSHRSLARRVKRRDTALAVIAIAGCLIGVSGCEVEDAGKNGKTAFERKQAKLKRQVAQLKMERLRELAKAKRRAKAAARQAYVEAQAVVSPEPEPAPAVEPASDCDPNYAGACLDPNASDYDCEGGSGDGPEYTGYVQVVGSDPFDLDSDSDGTGCE